MAARAISLHTVAVFVGFIGAAVVSFIAGAIYVSAPDQTQLKILTWDGVGAAINLLSAIATVGAVVVALGIHKQQSEESKAMKSIRTVAAASYLIGALSEVAEQLNDAMEYAHNNATGEPTTHNERMRQMVSRINLGPLDFALSRADDFDYELASSLAKLLGYIRAMQGDLGVTLDDHVSLANVMLEAFKHLGGDAVEKMVFVHEKLWKLADMPGESSMSKDFADVRAMYRASEAAPLK